MNGAQNIYMNYCWRWLAPTDQTIKKVFLIRRHIHLKVDIWRARVMNCLRQRESNPARQFYHTRTRSRVPHSAALSLCRWTVSLCLLLLLLLRSALVPFTWTPCLSVSCHPPYQSPSCLVLFRSSAVHIALRRTGDELRPPLPWHRLSFLLPL